MKIIRERDDQAVCRLRLAPAEGQAQIVLSGAGLHALQGHLNAAISDPNCRAVVLEGSAGAFCEGMDLSWVTSPTPGDLTESMAQFAKVLEALATAPLWVIVCVDGVTRAGGIGLAAAADLLLATASSSFGLPEVMLGLVPAMVLPLLCARMPEQKARRWAMMGENLDAATAQQLGLVDQVLPDAGALVKARKRALRQILRMHPDAVARCKRFCRDIQPMPLNEALAHGAHTTGSMLQEDERRAGIQRFLEGEPLPWFARYRSTPPTEPAGTSS